MKNSSLAILLAAGVVLLVGCGEEKEEFSRYPALSICEYDYMQDLSDSNPEVVYNAVCNLGHSARIFGKTLSAEDKDPESEEYKTAQAAYQKVCGLLDSRDPLTVAASLRFLQLFTRDYAAKGELIGPVCQIGSSHPLVQFEQIELLGLLADEETQLPEPLLRRLLESKSWIVSRSTYGLICYSSSDERLRQELVKRYLGTGDAKEKILLLSAFAAHTGPDEIALAKKEILAADNPTIRSAAVGLLFENADTPGVLSWMIDHYPAVNPDDENQEEIFEIVCAVDEGSKVEATHLLLAKGYTPDDEFLNRLNSRFEKESEELPEHLLEIEDALSTVPETAARWQALRQATADIHRRRVALRKEIKPLADEFSEKARAVLTEYGIPTDKQDQFLKPVTSLNMKQMLPAPSP